MTGIKSTGLTIQEAIRSGLPFRRAGEREWFGNDEGRVVPPRTLGTPDIMATDWEIKVERKSSLIMFECRWRFMPNSRVMVPLTLVEGKIPADLFDLDRKKTRVTIEVLE